MNCSIMPRAVRAARLAEVGTPDLMGDAGLPLSGQLAPAQTTHSKRRAAEAAGAPSKKAKPVKLSYKVDLLTAELAQMKLLLLAPHSVEEPSHSSPSDEYLRELHACWRDTKVLFLASRLRRWPGTLAAMQDAEKIWP